MVEAWEDKVGGLSAKYCNLITGEFCAPKAHPMTAKRLKNRRGMRGPWRQIPQVSAIKWIQRSRSLTYPGWNLLFSTADSL